MIRFAAINTPSSQGSSHMTHCNLEALTKPQLEAKETGLTFS
jgi:hypothetical protein